jgi:putative tricarboxylic transport membrane protein
MPKKSAVQSFVSNLFCLSAVAISFLVSTAVSAQWVPTTNVEIVVAAGPSGGNDRTARLIAKILQEHKLVHVPVVVINKPGAGGVIAQNYLTAHAHGGNYLMVTNPNLLTNPLTGVGSAKYTDLTPLVQLFTEYVLLVSQTKSRFGNAKAMLDLWRSDPSAISVAVAPGLGAGPHLAAALVARSVGVQADKLIVVPFVSAGEAMTALLGGHVDLVASTPNNVMAQIEAGKISALGVTSPERLDGKLAGIPIWRELGVDVEFGNWRGVVGPPGMTAEQIKFWEDVFAKIVVLPEWQQELAEQSAQAFFLTSQQSKVFLDAENVRLTNILKDLGLYKQQ